MYEHFLTAGVSLSTFLSGNGCLVVWPSRSSLRRQACFRLMCETKVCLQARQEGARVILSEAIKLLVRSAEKLHGSTQLWRTFVNSSYRSFWEEAQKLSTLPSSIYTSWLLRKELGRVILIMSLPQCLKHRVARKPRRWW